MDSQAKQAGQNIEDNIDMSGNQTLILGELNNSMKQKRKRRSKNDAEGRSFRCSECGKSYLSMPALTNHKKTKHNFGLNGEKKGRGRPRKNPPTALSNETVESRFHAFFERDIRRHAGEAIDLDFVNEAFREIFSKYGDVFKTLSAAEEHGFYKTIQTNWGTEAEAIKARPNVNCDEVFFLYVQEAASKTNKDYFNFLFKFSLLFRESINKFKKPEGLEGDYTLSSNAENVPDTCNEFISDFMEPNDYYGLDTNELIESIQHFCSWLYFNHYTTSRLTLL